MHRLFASIDHNLGLEGQISNRKLALNSFQQALSRGMFILEVISDLIFAKKTAVYSLWKMSNLASKIKCEINIPRERAHFEDQNACFLFEIGPSNQSYGQNKSPNVALRIMHLYRLHTL